ncbi:MAG: putative toxin-antitoxin system toxin component, PIN family [Flavobacteriales bacterium]|nr:putative toxin-antitoxin system toxin component, PIN family [Flavobacteriales bacterium]
MKIVVDTNIVFSAMLNQHGNICDLLLNSLDSFVFYSPSFVLEELDNHTNKLRRLTGYSEKELDYLCRILFTKVDLIDMETLQKKSWEKAIELTKNIDEFDAPFVALAIELDAPLWTGDKKLLNGLVKKGIDWILTTETVARIRNGN